MSSNKSVPAGSERHSRRAVLVAAGAGIVTSVAGCAGVLPGGAPESSTDPAEVVVENGTGSAVEIAVRIVDGDDETLFGHVFALDAETIRSRGAIGTTPERIHAFTPNRVSNSWRYDPDLPADFDCEIEDVGLTLGSDDAIEPWYSC